MCGLPKRGNLEGTSLEKILQVLAVEGLTLDLFRLIFFGDKSSADPTMNIIDGVWKKTFAGVADANPANAVIRTTTEVRRPRLGTQPFDRVTSTPATVFLPRRSTSQLPSIRSSRVGTFSTSLTRWLLR